MPQKEKAASQLRKYTYYSGLVFQMGIIIAAGTIGGVKLDKYLSLSPLFTLIGSMGSIALSLYLVIRELKPFKDKKNAKDSH